MIYPVILSGGSGTRLWPLSRKSYPKQFSKIIGDQTLFQLTCSRLIGKDFANPTIVTNENFRFTVLDELSDIGLDARNIILEPAPRNTAPAVLAATIDIFTADPDAIILVLPSDHSINRVDLFVKAIETAKSNMAADEIVTFGIKPSHPETGYGYLEISETDYEIGALHKLVQFVEKPNENRAQEMIELGNFLWNAGIFMARAEHFVNLFKKYQPEIYDAVETSLNGVEKDREFLRPDATAWQRCADISIDYGIMEKADKLAVIPLDMGWNDLGDWRSIWGISEQDSNGVATFGDVYSIGCKNSLLRSEKEGLALVGIGLENIVAVAMNDAVLVGHMDNSQEVKTAVNLLKTAKKKQADEFPRDHRPWGWYETLVLGQRFQVKRIVVKPGAALSLQSHHHRSEHWTVVEGTANVTINDEVKMLGENMSVYIPLGAVHRLENPGKIPLTLIEVQSGPYLGEDDIVRYEDQFGRT